MSSNAPRGFAILIVLAVIGTASVIISTQLASTESQAAAQLRMSDVPRARYVAEGCIERVDAYVQAYGNADDQRDFDELLDADGVIGSDDDYLPPATALPQALGRVFVPPSTSDAMHAYRAFRIDARSVCFIRFDDNQDDGNPNLAGEDDPGEGTGPNLNIRDRDRTILATAIGVIHAPGVDVVDAYARAHAVSTTRRVRAMPSAPPVEGMAIEAGTTVTLDGSVCGYGGLIADEVKGGLCICGEIDAHLVDGTQGACDGCDYCKPPGGTTTPGARPDPVVTVPSASAFLANEGIGAPGSSENNMAGDFCALYFRNDTATNPATAATYGVTGAGNYQPANSAEVFVWDKRDRDARDEGPGEPLNVTAVGGAVLGGDVPIDCAAVKSDPLPRPCKWTTTGTAQGVQCAAGESPCWKLVARLNSGSAEDVGVYGTTFEQASQNDFRPSATELANVESDRTFAQLCGGCSDCASPDTVVSRSTSDFTLARFNTADAPSPGVLFFDTAIASKVQVSSATPLTKVSVIAAGDVAVGAATMCCATCDCSALTAAAGVGCADLDDPNVAALGVRSGFAVKAVDDCTTLSNGNPFIAGAVRCDTFDAVGDACIVGDLVATYSSTDGGPIDCSGGGITAPFCDRSAICFKNFGGARGDLVANGNICAKNGLTFLGALRTKRNVGFKNNGEMLGRIIAEGAVIGKMNGNITYTPMGAGESMGAASAMWIETAW